MNSLMASIVEKLVIVKKIIATFRYVEIRISLNLKFTMTEFSIGLFLS